MFKSDKNSTANNENIQSFIEKKSLVLSEKRLECLKLFEGAIHFFDKINNIDLRLDISLKLFKVEYQDLNDSIEKFKNNKKVNPNLKEKFDVILSYVGIALLTITLILAIACIYEIMIFLNIGGFEFLTLEYMGWEMSRIVLIGCLAYYLFINQINKRNKSYKQLKVVEIKIIDIIDSINEYQKMIPSLLLDLKKATNNFQEYSPEQKNTLHNLIVEQMVPCSKLLNKIY